MQRYNNIKKYLEENKYTLTTIYNNDFIKNGKLSFTCESGHTTDIVLKTFENKKSNKTTNLCPDCKKLDLNDKKFLKVKEEILNKTGHILTSYAGCKYIVYTCGSCGSENNKTNTSSLYNNLGSCPKCSKDGVKNSVDDVKQTLLLHGFNLIEYTNNKKIIATCANLHKINVVLLDVVSGKKCPICKKENKNNIKDNNK